MNRDKNWELRYYRDGDEQGMLDLLTAAFGTWPAVDIDVPPIDHLRWKLDSDPLAKQFHYVADAGSRIIGTQLVVVQRLKVRERTLLVDGLTDYAVHPDYQGRGISREIWNFGTDRRRNTFDAVASISDSRIVKRQIDAGGYSDLIGNRPGWIERDSFSDVIADDRSVQIDTIDAFDERFDELFAVACASFDLMFARDRPFLNWRYADPRAGRYTVRFAAEDDKPVGYTVLTRSRGKGFIADLLVLPARLDVLDALVHDALRQFASCGVEVVRGWITQTHPYRETFLRHGFRPLRPVGYFGFGPHRGAELPPLGDAAALVHFTPGDTDIV